MDAYKGGMYKENRVDSRTRSTICNVPVNVSTHMDNKDKHPFKDQDQDQDQDQDLIISTYLKPFDHELLLLRYIGFGLLLLQVPVYHIKIGF